MFERFTERARRVVVLAQTEARLLNHSYIGTEHILLGLIREGEGIAAKALAELNVPLDPLRERIEEIIGKGEESPTGHVPFTPRAKKVLELSLREALHLGHNYIGTEHLLLGLVREGEGVGAHVLKEMGASLEAVRSAVLSLLSAYKAREPEAEFQAKITRESPEHREDGPLCPQCRGTLAITAVTRTIPVADAEQKEQATEIRFVYCDSCGTSLGVVP